MRTPKFAVAKKGEKSKANKYRKRLKLAPWIELLLGAWFMAAIVYTFLNHNYFTAPFLILFVVGFWYTGLMSLLQGRFDRWRTGKSDARRIQPPAVSRGRVGAASSIFNLRYSVCIRRIIIKM